MQTKPFAGGNNNAKKTLLLAIKSADDARLIQGGANTGKASKHLLASSGRTSCAAAEDDADFGLVFILISGLTRHAIAIIVKVDELKNGNFRQSVGGGNAAAIAGQNAAFGHIAQHPAHRGALILPNFKGARDVAKAWRDSTAVNIVKNRCLIGHSQFFWRIIWAGVTRFARHLDRFLLVSRFFGSCFFGCCLFGGGFFLRCRFLWRCGAFGGFGGQQF